MLREKIFGTYYNEKFRHRSVEIMRVEALSDAVFAFSVSLLVASLEVPQTFNELVVTINGALPFFATVAILFLLWYQQYIFFRHYGMNDFPTIILNLVYLAVILFYLYPLKFLFSLLLSSWTGINLFPRALDKTIITAQQFPRLVILYGIGYFVIWMLLYIMHQRALHLATTLQLNRYELLYTKKEKRGALMNALIGAVSASITWIGIEGLSGICYLFIPLVLVFNEMLFRYQIKKAGV
ncbi:MAG: TMEM175 family protein [Chitinophagales bacterium]